MAISFFEVTAAGRGPYPLQGLEYLLAEHLFVTEDDVSVPFTLDVRRQEVTLDNDPVAGATLRIGRTTPIADDDRIVDFLSLPTGQAGLTAELLRTDQRQLNFILGECRDARESGENLSGMGLNAAGEWAAEGLRIEDLALGESDMDAARKDQLNALVAGTLNLPTVNAGNNDNVLVVNAGAWAARTPAQGRTHWGLGTVATLNAGTSANNVVQLDSNARYPTADGRNIDLTNHPIQAEILKRALATVVRTNQTKPGNGLDVTLNSWTQNSNSRISFASSIWTARTELNNGTPEINGNFTPARVDFTAGTYRIRWLFLATQTSGSGTNVSFRITNNDDTSGQTIYYDMGVAKVIRQFNAGSQYHGVYEDEIVFGSSSAFTLVFRGGHGLTGTNNEMMFTFFFHKISASNLV